MNYALEYGKRQGYEQCWLGVWEHNYAAQEFYKSWGLERCSEHSFMVGEDNQTDFLFKRTIR